MAYLHRVSQKVESSLMSPRPGNRRHDTVHTQGVTNMEMEALVFAGLTHKAGIRSAVVCVTLLDRLQGDQVDILRPGSRNVAGENTKRGVDSLAGKTHGNCVQVALCICNIFSLKLFPGFSLQLQYLYIVAIQPRLIQSELTSGNKAAVSAQEAKHRQEVKQNKFRKQSQSTFEDD